MGIERHTSVHREIEAIKEAVAVNAIMACADWLRARDEHGIAEKLERDMLEADPDGD